MRAEQKRRERRRGIICVALIMKYSLINCNTVSGEKASEQRGSSGGGGGERGSGAAVKNVFGADSHLKAEAHSYVTMIK